MWTKTAPPGSALAAATAVTLAAICPGVGYDVLGGGGSGTRRALARRNGRQGQGARQLTRPGTPLPKFGPLYANWSIAAAADYTCSQVEDGYACVAIGALSPMTGRIAAAVALLSNRCSIA